jgi:DNA-binding NtrC family response regulator
MARILLADDDAATRDLVRRALSTDGHEVVASQDGLDALEKITANPNDFDALISDVDMPGLSGMELAAKVSAMDPRLVIILMSGLAAGAIDTSRTDMKISAFISKPFTLEQIRSLVRKAISA